MNHPQSAEDHVLINIDVPLLSDPAAVEAMELSRSYGVGIKLGTELTAKQSWQKMMSTATQYKIRPVFADTKANDIPRTVEATLRSIFLWHPELINIHANAGIASLEKFLQLRDICQPAALARSAGSLAIGVTVLTSKGDQECRAEFGGRTRKQQVRFYAHLLNDLGFDGLTCAGDELAMLNRERATRDMVKVVLGVRPEWAPQDDHASVMTPGEAIRRGASFLSIGRAITQPPPEIGSRKNALEAVLEEVAAALVG